MVDLDQPVDEDSPHLPVHITVLIIIASSRNEARGDIPEHRLTQHDVKNPDFLVVNLRRHVPINHFFTQFLRTKLPRSTKKGKKKEINSWPSPIRIEPK